MRKKIIRNNEFQRKRVKTSKTVYSLLKEDLKQGCVIPPIVLAISGSEEDFEKAELHDYIMNHTENVMILDGLQRTFTLVDAAQEMESSDGNEVFLNSRRIVDLDWRFT